MNQYFIRILESTRAKVVIALGKARAPVGIACIGRPLTNAPVQTRVAGIDRVLLGLGKPGSNERRTIPSALAHGKHDLNLIRRFIR